jgi:hypothetical protein
MGAPHEAVAVTADTQAWPVIATVAAAVLPVPGFEGVKFTVAPVAPVA